MIAVIFEVWPAEGQRDTYLDLAAKLKTDLITMEGFISIERFASLADSTKLLSLSFWEDEAAVQRWRNLEAHRETQTLGRRFVFRAFVRSVAWEKRPGNSTPTRSSTYFTRSARTEKKGIFSVKCSKDYRLRVAGVSRDYGMNQRAQAPADSRAQHDR